MREHDDWVIGFDMGGTYVDVAARASGGQLLVAKVPYEGTPALSAVRALERFLAHHGIAADSVRKLVHGSTVVTNLLLERDAPAIGVLTTAGFADVLSLRRQNRKELYGLAVRAEQPEHLFPVRFRREVTERVSAAAKELVKLDEEAVHAAGEFWKQAGVKAVAICFLHACRHPVHELRAQDILQECCPGLKISLSHEVDPAPREYERFLATALNAYASVPISDYMGCIRQGCRDMGLPEPSVMRSDGFGETLPKAMEKPVSLAMSGPAAALAGAVGCLGGTRQAVMIDIGGTTTDIGLIAQGHMLVSEEIGLGPFSLRLRSANVLSVAIGGGSIARMTPTGALRLGPQSQGATPGPAAYGKGGTEATLTDALVVLGRLPSSLAGGRTLCPDLARQALQPLADRRGCGLQVIAEAIVAGAHAVIAEGIKTHAYAVGLEPADCMLIAAGGGGAQHGVDVAELVGIKTVFLPPHSGVLAAIGLLGVCKVRVEEIALDVFLDDLHAAFPKEDTGLRLQEGESEKWSVALCYEGQQASIELPLAGKAADLAVLKAEFEADHRRLRGYVLETHRLKVRRLRRELILTEKGYGHEKVATQPEGLRDVAGPASVVLETTTLWIPAGWRGTEAEDGSWSVTPLVETDRMGMPL